jgi:hypothetical protein
VRFLYDFDNLLLSHKDRGRFVTDEFRTGAVTPHGPVPHPVLIDGVTAAAWTLEKTRGAATLAVRTFLPLSAADRDAASCIPRTRYGTRRQVRRGAMTLRRSAR